MPTEPLLWRLLPEVWDPHDRPPTSKLQQLWFLFIQAGAAPMPCSYALGSRRLGLLHSGDCPASCSATSIRWECCLSLSQWAVRVSQALVRVSHSSPGPSHPVQSVWRAGGFLRRCRVLYGDFWCSVHARNVIRLIQPKLLWCWYPFRRSLVLPVLWRDGSVRPSASRDREANCKVLFAAPISILRRAAPWTLHLTLWQPQCTHSSSIPTSLPS